MTYPHRLRALPDKAERLTKANEFIRVIATTGRKFFSHQDRVSVLCLDGQGRINLIDCYTKRLVYTHYNGEWRGFSQGGTMRSLIIRLREYIQGVIPTGAELFDKLPIHYGDQTICPNYGWGYPEDDMNTVIEAARRIFTTHTEST